MGPATVKSYAWPLITSPYLPAGNTKSSFSGLIISISEPSPNGATLKSYDIWRMVHVSCTFVVRPWRAALHVSARNPFRRAVRSVAAIDDKYSSTIWEHRAARSLDGCRHENSLVWHSADQRLQFMQPPATDRINAVDTWERKSQGLRRRRCYRRLNTVCRRLENLFRFRSLNFVDHGRERLWGLASENAEMTIQHRAHHNTENSEHSRPYQGCGAHPVP